MNDNTAMAVSLLVTLAIAAVIVNFTSLEQSLPKLPSLARVNQVLLFVVLAGVILFALGIVRCKAVITTS